MGNRLSTLLMSLGHNLELYATIVVCAFLLALKILHAVEDDWIFSAILVTLMLLALGSLRDRAGEKALHQSLEKIASKRNGEDALRWYTRRSEATTDMLADMDNFPHIVFLGISHRHLGSYLRDRLQHPGGPLPWESLEVYFASRVLGEAYEGRDFHRNLLGARQEIAALLTDPAYRSRLPTLRSVAFFQHDGFATHTGSMFGRSPQELAVIYSVHSAVHLHGDTHQGLTIRLSVKPGVGFKDGRFDHYVGIYRALSKSAVRLGVFVPSIWDSSAEQWSQYARQSGVLVHGARIVAEMMSPQAGDSVLDVGSGSGDSASTILERHPGVSMVLLDGSPQMVRLLRSRFHGEPRVRFALCHLPSLDGSSVDLGQDRFSFIVLHQSLSELVKSLGSLEELAMWCGRWLRAGGQCLLSAHNTVVATDKPKGFENWKDPFRMELAKRLKRTRYKQYVQEGPHMIAQGDIEAAFKSHGFTLEERRQEVIELDFEERRRLWHVPAVMDTLVHAGTTNSNEINGLVDDVVDLLRGQKTMPRTVVFWRFSLAGSSCATPVHGKAG